MATSFFLRTTKKTGIVSLFVRLQSTKQKINHKANTPIKVDIKEWKNSQKGNLQWNNFKMAHPSDAKKIGELKDALDATLSRETGITQQEFISIIDDVMFRDARESLAKKKAEEKAKADEAKRMTLKKFIAKYKVEVENGGRQTEQGKNYSPSSVKAIRGALNQFEYFQKDMRLTYDFKDIDMNFYYAYTAYLKKKEYSINSIGKCIKILKGVMAAAESEGYHNNQIFKDRKFKGARVDIDSIYLTREELDKMMNVDISKLSPGHEQARDIFMVGVWTAQRVSDYNNIHKEDFKTLVKNVMKEEPDPENPGQMRAWIEKEEVTYLNIRQQKTGAKVSIPCNSQLKAILDKYDYQMPHLEDQVINRYIKEVAKEAGLTDKVEVETTKGGTPKKEKKAKYTLIHTHTARRTGATLMYLAGMDVYDIMKVTGHSSPVMLKKYIRADQLDVVTKLTDKYDYFN